MLDEGANRGDASSFRAHGVGSTTIFLDHGGLGATLQAALASRDLWDKYIEQQPATTLTANVFPHLADTTRNVASFLGARPEEALPMSSVMSAMRTVLRSWERREALVGRSLGGRVLCLNIACRSTKELLGLFAKEKGLELDEIMLGPFPFDRGEEDVLDPLEASLSADTSLVVLDAMPQHAPILFPIAKAVERVRAQSPGALILVHAADAFAGLDANMCPSGKFAPDFWTTSYNTWFCGAGQTALLHTDNAQFGHLEWLQPLASASDYGGDRVTGYYNTAILDFSSYLSLDAVLRFWEDIGQYSALLYMQSLARDAAQMLADTWATNLGAPDDMFGPMVLVALPAFPAFQGEATLTNEHAEKVQNALRESPNHIEVPVCLLDGTLYVRISAHVYNHIGEYECLAEAVSVLQERKSLG